ncbi:hypothetical protein Hanom_Chr16g01479401 [Helianthus anomalus]
MIMYKMFGSDKLFLNDEFLIQNVNLKKLVKVFKLVEIQVYEIENLASTARYLNLKKDKSYYTKPRNSNFQKRNFKMKEQVWVIIRKIRKRSFKSQVL